ncbi:MAG: transglutaminase-like domain-containing protein [Candidatus Micrarchaeota archaeon]|nr:transglutaminase-like domain-containing protein [Candidatus Micrarchaeota archaeon]
MTKQLRKPAGTQLQVDENKLRAEAMWMGAYMLKRYAVYKGFDLASPYIKRLTFAPSKRRFAALCSLIGASPKDEFLKVAKEVRGLVNDGVSYNFGHMADFSRKDLSAMDEIIRAVGTSEEKFPAASKKAMEQVLASVAMKRIYAPDLFIHGKHYPLGAWNSIRKQKPIVDGDCFDEVLNISAPIIPGKDIKIEIKSPGKAQAWWESNLAGQEAGDFAGKICTFPEGRALFSGTQLAKHENGVYTFIARYAGKSEKPISKEEYRALWESVKKNIPQKALSGLMTIANEIDYIKKSINGHRLVIAFACLLEKSTGESVELDGSEDLEYLVERLLNEKAYPGDCKSVSTMSVGLATCLGYVARRVSGEVADLEGNEIASGGGHVWAEVLHPKKNIWLPFDPAQGAPLAFPKNKVYRLHDEIPKSLAPFEIRVSHE